MTSLQSSYPKIPFSTQINIQIVVFLYKYIQQFIHFCEYFQNISHLYPPLNNARKILTVFFAGFYSATHFLNGQIKIISILFIAFLVLFRNSNMSKIMLKNFAPQLIKNCISHIRNKKIMNILSCTLHRLKAFFLNNLFQIFEHLFFACQLYANCIFNLFIHTYIRSNTAENVVMSHIYSVMVLIW